MTLDDNPIPFEQPETSGATPTPPSESASDIALPQDLRVPWTWLDLLLLGVVAVAGSIVLDRMVGRAFWAFGVTPSQFRASPTLFGLFTVVHQILLFALLLAYLFAQLRVNFRMPFWRTIGWHALEPGQVPRALRYFGFVVGGFLLALMVQVLSYKFSTKAKLPIQQLFQDRRIALVVLLMAVFVAPWVEETIFRGYIYPVVARSYGATVGVLGTGVLFGLLHAPQLWGGWVQISALVMVGIILTYARAVTRTVLASFLLHLSYNFFISFGIAIIVNGLRLIAPRH
jgi:membrane protease YdiL (CAAX protease family)